MIQKIHNQTYRGIIDIPPSKSDSQRALLCAGLAFGNSILQNVGESEDEKAMIATIRSFGARIHKLTSNTLEIKGVGGLTMNSIAKINLGESGLGARLLTPIAATSNLQVELMGHGSLLNRDFSFFERFLPEMGVDVRTQENKLPISVHGPMKGGNYLVDGSESSQYISGLLMALPLASEKSELIVENLVSQPYVQMTLNTIMQFGISIDVEQQTYRISENQYYKATNYTIDGDWSSASYWLVASALGMDITVKGLAMSSLQADRKILDAFLAAGCRVSQDSNGLSVDGKHRKPFTFDATNCPDLFPALVVLACFTSGKSTIIGVERLANKESHRALTLKQEFEKLGFRIDLLQNEMHVYGGGLLTNCICESHGDHRIAMSLAIAGMQSADGIEILGAESVQKSYPRFWDDLNKLSS